MTSPSPAASGPWNIRVKDLTHEEPEQLLANP